MSLKYFVASDIHSNLPALQTVLADAEKHGPYDGLLNAGDLVGYGPNPNECIATIRERGFTSVLGNHDRLGKKRPEERTGSSARFNPDARKAVHYTQEQLTEGSREYLRALRNIPYVDPKGRFAMVHGSFAGSDDSYENIYVFDARDAADAMCSLYFDDETSEIGCMHVNLGIVGHTHVPTYARSWIGYSAGYRNNFEFTAPLPASVIEVNFGAEPAPTNEDILWKPKVLFNPGSVGQPRDGDPRASYGIVTFDGGKITLEVRRVEYDVAETQRRMRDAGLPIHLIDRIAIGR